MSNCDFTDGMRRLLRGNPALPADRTRELAGAFKRVQEDACRLMGAMSYPLARVIDELKDGRMPYFREGSDQDRKHNSGRKAAYRFPGFTPSHVEEVERRLASEESSDWQSGFLMGFTFEAIEQIALRAVPSSAAGEEAALCGVLAKVLAEARSLRDTILSGNLLLVAKIVRNRGRFHVGGILDDLFAAGVDGLMIAINRYDPSVGHFSTYATPWIKMAVDRHIAKTRHVIRIPIGLQEKARRERREGGGADAASGGAISLIPEVQSMEEPLAGFSDNELRLEDVMADPSAVRPIDALERSDLARILEEGMGELDDLRQFVIAMRNDIGDAAELGAKLFDEEAALSLARGRAIAAAASKCLDEPARIVMVDAPSAVPHSEEPEAAELAFAV